MGNSSPAVDVVKAAYAAFGRGDIPAIVELADDDIEWTFHGPQGQPYTASFRGKGPIPKWFASVFESDDIQAFEPREFLAQGDHVTVLGWERARALPAGKVYESEWVHVFTVRNGRITRYWGMHDTEAAAAARA